jgi:hypothetical protein
VVQSWWTSEVNRQRVRRIAPLAGLLVAVNIVARLVARFTLPTGTDPFLVGAWSLLAMVLAVAVVAFPWTRRQRVPTVVGDLFFVILVTTVLVTLVGPFVSREPAFDVGFTIQQFALCAGLLVVGGAAGLLTAVALGLDPTSRAWRAQAERARVAPTRRKAARPARRTAAPRGRRQSGARR